MYYMMKVYYSYSNSLQIATSLCMLVALSWAEVVDIIDFFPDIGDDLSEVTWVHAINSKDDLENCIQDVDLMMLEADVSKGHLKNQSLSDPAIPIMAHPPAFISDISLEQWLSRVIEVNQHGKKKGAKLDFKDLDIVEESLQILKNNSKEISFPLWLNADILKGPGSEKQPIDAKKFLNLCSAYFPSATLSVGWTTQYIPEGAYTQEMVEEMKQVLADEMVDQPVTFPIRAAFVVNSLDTLEWLLDNTHDLHSTITVWSSASDSVNITALVMLRDRVGHNVVYYDLPEDQQKEFDDMKNHSLVSYDLPEDQQKQFDDMKNSGNPIPSVEITFLVLYLCISKFSQLLLN